MVSTLGQYMEMLAGTLLLMTSNLKSVTADYKVLWIFYHAYDFRNISLVSIKYQYLSLRRDIYQDVTVFNTSKKQGHTYVT